MDCLSIQLPNPNAIAEEMGDAAHDEKKLQRVLVGAAAAKGSVALLAFFRAPGGVFHRDKLVFYAYYGILVVAIFGALEVAAGFWVCGDPQRRRGRGKLMIWASVVPLVLVAGIGGFAVLK